jgi:hypothetical protein
MRRPRISLALSRGDGARTTAYFSGEIEGGEPAREWLCCDQWFNTGIEILNGSTVEQLRDDIDHGRTGDKVDAPDPAAVPLGADEEAAGTPPGPAAVDAARSLELSRPGTSISPRGPGAAWLLITFAAALGAGLVAWMLWLGR